MNNSNVKYKIYYRPLGDVIKPAQLLHTDGKEIWFETIDQGNSYLHRHFPCQEIEDKEMRVMKEVSQ